MEDKEKMIKLRKRLGMIVDSLMSAKINIEYVTATQILFLEQPIYLFFEDLIRKLEYQTKTSHYLQSKLDQADADNLKKDKIIDEMVKVIIDSGICDYFIRIKCKYYAEKNKKNCSECIKRYFYKKVEEEEK